MSDRAWITTTISFCVVVLVGFLVFWFWPQHPAVGAATSPLPAIASPSRPAKSMPAPPPPAQRVATIPLDTLPSNLPPTPTPVVVLTRRISGGAWLTKNGGESDLQRGLRVFVFTDPISTTPVKRWLSATASADQKSAADIRAAFSSIDRSASGAIAAANKGAADVLAAASTLAGQGAALPAKAWPGDFLTALDSAHDTQEEAFNAAWDVGDPYAFPKVGEALRAARMSVVGGNAAYALLADIAESATATTKCNIDGKYTFAQASTKRCVIFAFENSASMRIVWCVDVPAGSADVELDLDNENATSIVNKS